MDFKLHSRVELQSKAKGHSDTEINLNERNVKLPNREVYNESRIQLHERPIVERSVEPRLLKYVKRHHPAKKIIGDKEDRPMTRNRLRNDTYFLSMHEPKSVKDALENEEKNQSMKE